MLLVCVAGATTGATALIFDTSRERVVAVAKGSGILPLEQDENALYLRVQEVCNTLASDAATRIEPSAFIFSLSSQMHAGGEEVLRAAVNHSRLRPKVSVPLTWLMRGEACWWAAGASKDAVIVKVGTVGFAHAFRHSFPMTAESWRAGGWGLLSGDDGGAYYIGRQILYRLFEEQDGRKARTRFSESFSEMMREQDTRAVTTWIRQHKDTYSLRLEVSRLAQAAVFLAEQQHDAFSVGLLRRAAAKVARSFVATVATARRQHPEYGDLGLDVCVQGRLVQFSPLYARFLADTVRRLWKGAMQIRPLHHSPVLGCLQKGLVSNAGWERADATRICNDVAATLATLTVEFSSEVEQVFDETHDERH